MSENVNEEVVIDESNYEQYLPDDSGDATEGQYANAAVPTSEDVNDEEYEVYESDIEEPDGEDEDEEDGEQAPLFFTSNSAAADSTDSVPATSASDVDEVTEPTIIEGEVVTATQVAYPWRATVRTGLQVIASLAVVIPTVLAILSDQLASLLGPDAMAAITGAGIAVVAVSIAITRIMAIPQVNLFLAKFGLAAQPKDQTTN